MKIQRAHGVVLAGMVCALQIGAVPRAAGQSVFLARQPMAHVHSASKSGAAQQAERIPFLYSLPASMSSPSGAFHSPGRRLDISADSPRLAFRLQRRLDPSWREESERYFSNPVIEEMESSFQTVDTPFASEVRLSLGTLWKGRMRIDCFTDSRAMENVMLGLPVAGMASGARLAGGGLLQFEDEVYGVQMVIRIHRTAANPEDSNAVRGLHRVYRTGRGFFLR